mmetsp:Transcript_1650/g.2066  ORF Transcript_1650/g.2066 Transcript_1650/m.2066 type:complete len:344 (-) Transcript_1650:172-1203(-)
MAAAPPTKKARVGEKREWPLSTRRKVTVDEWNGKTLVSIREFYTKDGKSLPGKGISLTTGQFEKLRALKADVEKALEMKDELDADERKEFGRLSMVRKVSLKHYSGVWLVDIREMYKKKDGMEVPGRKGISLNEEQWNKLSENMEVIQEAILEGGVKSVVPSSSNGSSSSISKKEAESIASAGGKAEGDSALKDENKDGPWSLSSKRKVSVNEYRGTLIINFREYYLKDGKELPGRKGIALNVDQWKKVFKNMEEINRKLESEEEGQWPISHNRKACIREFNSKYMVDVREFYTKDGKECPGKKGIMMPQCQWTKFIQSANAINAVVLKRSQSKEVDNGKGDS